jgi:hypothetical protein
MPVETRYMRGDQHAVNGLTAYILGVSQSDIPKSGLKRAVGTYYGIRVYKRSANGTQTEITPGQAVAIVQSVEESGYLSATWDCPETALTPTDAIVVEVWEGATSPPSTAIEATFITEQLGASKLDAATWTVYYYIYYYGRPPVGVYFYWGTPTYNSRIENFTWTRPSRVSFSDVEKGFGEDNVYSGKAYSQYDNTIVSADPTKAFEVSLLDAWNNGTSDTTIGFRFGTGTIRFQKKLPPRSGFIINLVKAKWRGPVNTPFNIYSYDPTPKISFTVTGELV